MNKWLKKTFTFLLSGLLILSQFSGTMVYADSFSAEEENVSTEEGIFSEETDGFFESGTGDLENKAQSEEAQSVSEDSESFTGANQPKDTDDFRENLSGNGTIEAPYEIASAEDLPISIEADAFYVLTADIRLAEGQMIETVEGTLDGKGHTITLADKPLANTVSGTIQNLGVTSETDIVSADTFGSMAFSLTGTIQNCFSTAKLKLDSFMNSSGGLVGTMDGGSIKNSYFAGSIDDFLPGGLVGINNSTDSVLANSYWTVGSNAVSLSYGLAQITDCAKKTVEDLRSEAFLALLNTDLPNTGFYWAGSLEGGLPILLEGVPPTVEVDTSILEEAIELAEALNEEEYMEDTWSTFSSKLSLAKEILKKESATQKEINNVADALNEAIGALAKKKPTVPVAKPEDSSKIISIASASDLQSLDMEQSMGSYYVLTEDITIDGNYYLGGEFNGTLDGQGHTVTFADSVSMFSWVGPEGVLQNIYFTGTLSGYQASGPVGTKLAGAVINCYSDISGKNACGFAGSLNGGTLANSYSVSAGNKGALFNKYVSGTIVRSYWSELLSNPELFPVASLIESGEKADAYMRSKDFVQLLNENRGENGTAWGQSSEGYPYFGEDQEYVPEGPTENKYQVSLIPENGMESILATDGILKVSPDIVDRSRIAGTLQLEGVPKTSQVEWSCSDTTPDGAIDTHVATGKLYVYKEGSSKITATEIKEDGSRETAAVITVMAKTVPITDLKLSIDDRDVTDGSYTVQGSEWKEVQVQAKLEGNETYFPLSTSRIKMAFEDESMIYNNPSSRAFYFQKPGTTTVTVSSVSDPSVSASISLTSNYVPVESIRPAISGTVEIHGRNANSTGEYDFLPDYSSVIIEPENASYREGYTITSSNPEVASYMPSMVVGYVPLSAGTTVYTASIKDIDPETGKTKTISGDSTVTYTYLNPLTSVQATSDTISVEAGESESLGLNFTGEVSEEGWSVTEPAMNWTFSQDGIVSITRQKKSYWNHQEGAKDYLMFIAGTEYQVQGLKAGTVVATGTPVDQTNQVEPVVLTITVTGSETPVDIMALIAQGRANAIDYIKSCHEEKGYVYGDEWAVFTLLRSGESIDQTSLESYYASVSEEIQKWAKSDEEQKPTDLERAALALAVMGRDITNVDGVNLAEMIYNSSRLDEGSNELVWALLALDASNITIPDDAKWSRTDIIESLIEGFQNESGGFGLGDNKTSDVDLSAMAVQALSKYKENDTAATAGEKAIEYLKSVKQADYGYGNCESSAQVLLALAEWETDPLLEEAGFGTPNVNLITDVMKYENSEGGFHHLVGGDKVYEMSTIQALQSFDAYLRYVNGEDSYWAVNGSQEHTHQWGAWETTDKATVFAPERQTRICSLCGEEETRDYGEKLEPTIQVTADTLPMQVGQKTTEFVVTGLANGDSVKEWKSGDTSILKVTGKEDGTSSLEAQEKAGETTVTIVLASGLEKVIAIQVQEKPVEATQISGIQEEISIRQGGEITLTPVLSPITCQEKATYKTDNAKIATVSADGVVKGVKPGTAKITVAVGNVKAVCTVQVEAFLAKSKITSVKSWGYNALKISWDAVEGADGYRLYVVEKAGGKWKYVAQLADGDQTSYVHTGRITGNTYTYYMRAYENVGGEKVFGAYSSAAQGKSQPKTAVISKLTAGSKQAVIQWDKVNGATGYRLYYRTSPNGTWKYLTQIGKGSTTTYSHKGLTKGKTYYYKMRAYRTVNGEKIFGAYAAQKSVKIK